MLKHADIETNVSPEDQLPPDCYSEFAEIQIHAIGKINSTIMETFPRELGSNTMIHFFTCAHWSSHELLSWILAQCGPSEVFISVWSISEAAARHLIGLLDAGVITSLQAVVDFRAKNRHPAAFELARNNFSQLTVLPCHAKVTVVKNGKFSLVMNSSANYTNNPRPEAGFISTYPETVDFYHGVIQAMLTKAQPFL